MRNIFTRFYLTFTSYYAQYFHLVPPSALINERPLSLTLVVVFFLLLNYLLSLSTVFSRLSSRPSIYSTFLTVLFTHNLACAQPRSRLESCAPDGERSSYPQGKPYFARAV